MAENKKSFVLYCDIINTVRKLSKEQAGELFNVILGYVNDENPEANDFVVEIAFEPIKQQLKRDLVRYETKKAQWSEAGKKSAESKKINERQQTLTTVRKNQGRSTDSTVNVNVNDNVNVNVIKEESALTQSEIGFLRFNDWIKNNAPQVAKMKEPFTISEYERLKSDYDTKFIESLLLSMHNYKPLTKNNQSANLTFRKWALREFKNKPTTILHQPEYSADGRF